MTRKVIYVRYGYAKPGAKGKCNIVSYLTSYNVMKMDMFQEQNPPT